MAANTFFPELEKAVESKALELFSEGTLGDKKVLSLELSELEGINLYGLAVPWRLFLPNDITVTGFSETLRQAAKDIHAYCLMLARTLPDTTEMKIGIDEDELVLLTSPSPASLDGG